MKRLGNIKNSELRLPNCFHEQSFDDEEFRTHWSSVLVVVARANRLLGLNLNAYLTTAPSCLEI